MDTKKYIFTVNNELVDFPAFFVMRLLDLSESELLLLFESEDGSSDISIQADEFSTNDIKIMKKYYADRNYKPYLYNTIDSRDFKEIAKTEDYLFFTNINEEEVCSLLNCADYFKANELVNLCCAYLGSKFYFKKIKEAEEICENIIGIGQLEEIYNSTTEMEIFEDFPFLYN